MPLEKRFGLHSRRLFSGEFAVISAHMGSFSPGHLLTCCCRDEDCQAEMVGCAARQLDTFHKISVVITAENT